MAEELTFKQKILKALYGYGFKGQGPALLREYRKGGTLWIGFVESLFNGNDYPTRKLALKMLTAKGFLEKSKQKERLLGLVLRFLTRGLGEEKRSALKFVSDNLHLFPKDDDAFRSVILGLQREKDLELSNLAEALLPRIGINMDDRDIYRRS